MVALKRLKDANERRRPRACDHPRQRGQSGWAVQRSTAPAVRRGGRHPRPLGKAGIAPHLSATSGHGTGTQLGDPLEAQALGAVFAEGRPSQCPLLVGSVKSNIGHLESAAGAIGLIKTVLALQHAQIPASLHVKTPSPHIPWRDLGLKVADRVEPWPEIEERRIGGVSSFGFSGTNAHVLVERRIARRALARRRPRPPCAAVGAQARVACANWLRRTATRSGRDHHAERRRAHADGRPRTPHASRRRPGSVDRRSEIEI